MSRRRTCAPGVAHTGEGLEACGFSLGEGKTGFSWQARRREIHAAERALGRGCAKDGGDPNFGWSWAPHHTHREMFSVPGGGLVIDTPGLREIQLLGGRGRAAGVFPEIAALATDCRYKDCRHQAEPAAPSGRRWKRALPAERWAAYEKLQKELAYLQRKQTPCSGQCEAPLESDP